MPQLPVNLEEEFGKIVGNRVRNPSALAMRGGQKADATAWRRAFGGVRVPRGIYRFRSHEEADEWLWQMISRPRQS